MGITLNSQQRECVDMCKKWYRKISSKQVVNISGCAGTGKTTTVKYLIQELGLDMADVLFVAYTGKAALNLQLSGVSGRTIHSTCYDIELVPVYDDDNKLVIRNNRVVTRPEFVLKERLPENIKLIVIDEAPMVNETFGIDIESFGIPIIALGDLQQLPPVIGTTRYMIRPDYVLTQIMRQKEGDPIIYLSQLAARGEKIPYGRYGDKCFVIPKHKVTDDIMKSADMIVTPTNANRALINKYMREEIYRINSELPVRGEKVICRKNNWNRIEGDGICLVNGMSGFIKDVDKSTYNGKQININFTPDFDDSIVFNNVKIDNKILMNSLQGSKGKQEKGFSQHEMFEFAHAISVHLSQGSQAPNVLYMKERFGNFETQCKMDYTAITRAREGLVIAY